MSELLAVQASSAPVTVDTLVQDLLALGLRPGATVLTHSSLSSLGWVCGGPVAVVAALLDVLGPAGTLVVPTHTGDLSDPAEWANPPVPESWWPTIRDTMPVFDPDTAPCRGVGVVPDVVRTWPGAVRSRHPHVSFAAVGRLAGPITGDHRLAYGLGEHSPLARLAEVEAQVLLLGVGHDRSTSLHLAEYRSGVRDRVRQAGPLLVQGRRRWVSWDDIDLDSTDFAAIGADFERGTGVTVGAVGRATARLLSQPAVVEFATTWLTERSASTG